MACTCGPNEACSDCPTTVNALYEDQRRCVNALQKRVLNAALEHEPSGQVKDLALSLAVAVDKLQQLGGGVTFTNNTQP